VLAAQQGLGQFGYGTVFTAILDAKTQEALRSYQRRNGLPVTGDMDGPTWAHLQEDKSALEPKMTMGPLYMFLDSDSLGAADDKLPADGVTIFSYEQAHKRASEWLPTALQKSTGVVPRRRDYTVLDACDDYLNALEGRKATYIPRKIINAVITPALGAVSVEKLTRARIEQWLKQTAETPRRKPRNGLKADDAEALRRRKDSANRYLTILRAALTRALADGKVACAGIAWRSVKPFAQVDQRRTRFLSDDEARKIVDKCGTDFGLLVRAALFSGCRYGELARLLTSDF
jgi:peptidoglycan hydrolase-like protein with peptidoglycan-binding domain